MFCFLFYISSKTYLSFMVFSRIPVPYLWWRIACIFSRTELIVHQQQTTTFVLRPFSSLREGLAGGSPWQFPSLSVIMRILLFQSTISHVPFHHLTPRHLPSSSSCRAFHFIRRAFLHPVIIILRITCSNHLSRFRFTTQTLTQSLFYPSALRWALYPSEVPHTSILPFSSLFVPISCTTAK